MAFTNCTWEKSNQRLHSEAVNLLLELHSDATYISHLKRTFHLNSFPKTFTPSILLSLGSHPQQKGGKEDLRSFPKPLGIQTGSVNGKRGGSWLVVVHVTLQNHELGWTSISPEIEKTFYFPYFLPFFWILFVFYYFLLFFWTVFVLQYFLPFFCMVFTFCLMSNIQCWFHNSVILILVPSLSDAPSYKLYWFSL